MAIEFDLEKFKELTLEKRHNQYRNSLSKPDDPVYRRFRQKIEECGVPYIKKKGIADGDPELKIMELIINNPHNEPAMLSCVHADRPPLEAVEPLIVEALGKLYTPETEGTEQAGYLVGKRMYALGFEKGPSKDMPEGSVAKTAATFFKRK